MPKPPSSWKAWETRVARIFGGKRRGAYVSNGKSGKSDIIKDGWSIEVKLNKRPHFQMIFDACKQAEINAENPLDIPVAVIKKLYTKDDDALVVMRLETFREHFIGDTNETR